MQAYFLLLAHITPRKSDVIRRLACADPA